MNGQTWMCWSQTPSLVDHHGDGGWLSYCRWVTSDHPGDGVWPSFWPSWTFDFEILTITKLSFWHADRYGKRWAIFIFSLKMIQRGDHWMIFAQFHAGSKEAKFTKNWSRVKYQLVLSFAQLSPSLCKLYFYFTLNSTFWIFLKIW